MKSYLAFSFSLVCCFISSFAMGQFVFEDIYHIKKEGNAIYRSKGLKIISNLINENNAVTRVELVNSSIFIDLERLSTNAVQHVRIPMPEAILKCNNLLNPVVISSKYILIPNASSDVFMDAPSPELKFMSVTPLAENGQIVAIANRVGESTQEVMVVLIKSRRISSKFTIEGDFSFGDPMWLDKNTFLLSFVGKKGGAFGIVDIEQRRVIEHGCYKSSETMLQTVGSNVFLRAISNVPLVESKKIH